VTASTDTETRGGLPRVSVIVPVLDGAGHIDRCLAALRVQTYPSDRVEIIVVDNGSVDETRGRVRDHGLTPLVERSARSPYVARNRGLAQARGAVLAFTDSDCAPAKDWLERGVNLLLSSGADLVGGQVRFCFDGRPSSAQILDSITNLDQAYSVREQGAAKTGNLFVTRRAFDELGNFAADRRSGGDVEFTQRATAAGFDLVYAEDAWVEKPARRAVALARKQYRVGRGQMRLWEERGLASGTLLRTSLRALLPANPRAVRDRLAARGPEGSGRRLLSVWLTAWWVAAVQAAGRLQQAILGGKRG